MLIVIVKSTEETEKIMYHFLAQITLKGVLVSLGMRTSNQN